jgi:hypothetical protein
MLWVKPVQRGHPRDCGFAVALIYSGMNEIHAAGHQEVLIVGSEGIGGGFGLLGPLVTRLGHLLEFHAKLFRVARGFGHLAGPKCRKA